MPVALKIDGSDFSQDIQQRCIGVGPEKTEVHYLVLTHSVTRIQDDPLAHHCVFIRGVVVEAVVGLSSVLQLQWAKDQVNKSFRRK